MSNENSSKSKFWLLTMNTDDEDPEGDLLQRSIGDIEHLYNDNVIDYAVGQWERGGKTNRLHIQAYLVLKERKYRRWLSSRIFRAHCEMSYAKLVSNGIKYCNDPEKEGYVSKAFEHGTPPRALQGRRTDLEEVDAGIASGEITTMRDVNNVRVSVAANHMAWAKIRLGWASHDQYLADNRYDDPYEPRVWQYWLRKILDETRPSERKVLFVVDKVGHSGKTRFAFEYERSSGKRTQFLRVGPKRDMVAAMENMREVLFIDIPRGRQQWLDNAYVFMEEAKDGRLFNEKYGSTIVHQPRMHLVVFMNEDVNVGQKADLSGQMFTNGVSEFVTKPQPLSHDRYAIWDNDYVPELNDVWSVDHPRFGLDCPPFIAFDEGMSTIEYVPPIPPATSGPEFSSDPAGDGPVAEGHVFPVVVYFQFEEYDADEIRVLLDLMRPGRTAETFFQVCNIRYGIGETANMLDRNPGYVSRFDVLADSPYYVGIACQELRSMYGSIHDFMNTVNTHDPIHGLRNHDEYELLVAERVFRESVEFIRSDSGPVIKRTPNTFFGDLGPSDRCYAIASIREDEIEDRRFRRRLEFVPNAEQRALFIKVVCKRVDLIRL